MNIKKTRSLRHVRRFNFHHCNQYESVAEHSFYVAIIAGNLAVDLGIKFDEVMVINMLSLYHDVEESVTGDIPHLVKRNISNIHEIVNKALIELNLKLPELSKLEKSIIEFADCYELKIYLEEERRSGNMTLFDIERETWRRLLDIDIENDFIKNQWLSKLETVKPKKFPNSMTHEGE